MGGVSLPPPTLPPPSPPTPPLPAGWYDDPWDERRRRYWDGGVWTGYTDDLYHLPAGGEDAAHLVTGNRGVTRWLSRAVLVTPVFQIVSLASSANGLRDALETINDPEAARSTLGATNGWLQLGQVLSLLSLVVLVLRMVWLYRASQAAQALGHPLRREPGLTCAGWIIPIVNFWWPYQGMVALFAADDPARRRVGPWWACYLVSSIGGLAGAIASAWLPLGGDIVVIGVPAAFGMVSAFLERGLVLAAQRDQAVAVGVVPDR